MATSLVDQILKDNLCLGCGMCEAVYGKENARMELSADGFFYPVITNRDNNKEEIIDKICPGKNVVNDLQFSKSQSVWGLAKAYYSGYCLNNEIRTKGSSGGIVSGIAIYMLETKAADAVLQVGGDASDYERNALKVSRTREDVLACASSRYAPALIFNKIFDLLKGSEDTFVFIGKPCDISGLKNFLNQYPEYRHRFKLTVSIMCAGMPSFKGTKAIIDEFKAVTPVSDLVYRGNGWPGLFSFKDKTGEVFSKTYNDSWGKTLNRHLNFRCKICPDGIGIQADIAVGDAWKTTDGYPDFTEREGFSLVISRTEAAQQLLAAAVANNFMQFDPLEESTLALMQPYQYNRRTRVAARVLAVFMARKRKVVNYKNLHIYDNALKVPFIPFLRECWGTFKRVRKLNT